MTDLPIDTLLELDRNHVWHPYAAMPGDGPVYPVASAEGVFLELADGRKLIDGMSSWWTAIHGYRHPRLDAAAKEQLSRMSHVMFGGLTHQPGVQLAARLVEITPEPLQQVFFADSGSVAVEVAMKMAVQYWYCQGKAAKQRFMTIRSGYYGDTLSPMSVCDPITGMHSMFSSYLPVQFFADAPQISFSGVWDESDIASFETLLANHHHELAAVILEPIVQGAGGMRFYSPSYLRRARELCDHWGVLLIADEIASGFGRSGALFACEHAGIAPDILCLGKALTGGYLTLAAVLTTERVSRGFRKSGSGVLMHGPTFMANPLACAISLSSLELLFENNWQTQVAGIEKGLRVGLEPCRGHPAVQDVRVLGAIGVVEMKDSIDIKTVQPRLVEQGVWLRPFGKLLYTMPPYVIDDEQLAAITNAMCQIVAECDSD